MGMAGMRHAWATALGTALTLGACGGGSTSPAGAAAPASAPADRQVAPATDTAATPATDTRSAPAPDAADARAGAPASGEARLDGFGPLRLGMGVAEAEAAWPGLLTGTANAQARRDCFHVNIDLPYFALMFDDGRFVRYGGSNDSVTAPGGGRRGLAEAALTALYHDALQATPDRFAPGGKLLSLQASGVAPSKLVFVLRPDGVVDEWHVGLLPQADYDEGCESDT